MQPINKTNIILFSLFLCLGSQMHSVEFEGSKLPPREEFVRSFSTRAHEWLYQKEIAARRVEKIHNTDLENAKQWSIKRNAEKAQERQKSLIDSQQPSTKNSTSNPPKGEKTNLEEAADIQIPPSIYTTTDQIKLETKKEEASNLTQTNAIPSPNSEAETFGQGLNNAFQGLKNPEPSSPKTNAITQRVNPKDVNQSIEQLPSNDIPETLKALSSNQMALRPNESLSANRPPQASKEIASAYQTLGLNPNVVDQVIIDKKHRELALQLHPDKANGNKNAFQDLESAYQTIKEHLENNLNPSGSAHYIQGHDTPKQILGKSSDQSTKALDAMADKKPNQGKQSEKTLPTITQAEQASKALSESKKIGERYKELTLKVSTIKENMDSLNKKLTDDAISREAKRLSESEKYKTTLQESHTTAMKLVDLQIQKALEIVDRNKEEKVLKNQTKALKESQSAINQKEKEIEEIYRKAPTKDRLSLENNAELAEALESYKLLESQQDTILASLKNVGTLVNPNFKVYQAKITQNNYITESMNDINNASPEEKAKYQKEIIDLAKKRNSNLANVSDEDLIKIGLKIGYSDLIYEALIESIMSDPFNYQAKFNAIKKQLSPATNSLPITEEIKTQILSDLCPSSKDLSINQKNNLFEKLNNGESVESLLQEETTEEQEDLPINNSPFILDKEKVERRVQEDLARINTAGEAIAEHSNKATKQDEKSTHSIELDNKFKKAEDLFTELANQSSLRKQNRNALNKLQAQNLSPLAKSTSNAKLTPEKIAENRAKAPKLNPARAAELQQQKLQADNALNENLRRIVNDDQQKKAQAVQELTDKQNEILNESEMDRRSRISDQEANDFNRHLLQFQTRIGEQRQKENMTQESVNRAKLKAEENSELKAIKSLQDQIKTELQKETADQAEKLAQEEKAAQENQKRLIDFQQKTESDKQSLVSEETNARTSIENEKSNELKNIEAEIAAMKQKEIILDNETGRKSINSNQEADLETLRQNMLSEVTQLKQAEEKKAKDLAEANKASKIDPMIKTIERNLKTPAELAKDKAEKEAENKKTISRRNKIIEDISNAKVAIRIAESRNSNLEKSIAKESLGLLNEEKETLLKSSGTLVSQSFKPFSQTIDDFSKQITTAENELLILAKQIKEITDNLNKLSSTDNSLDATKIRSENSKLKKQQADLNKKISGLKTAQQSSFEAISSYIKTDFPFDYQAKLNKLIEESQAKKPISKVDKIKLIEQMIPQIKNLTDDKKELISNLFYPKVSKN